MVQKGLRIRLGRAHMLVVTPGKIALYLGMAVLAVFMALPLLYVAVTASSRMRSCSCSRPGSS